MPSNKDEVLKSMINSPLDPTTLPCDLRIKDFLSALSWTKKSLRKMHQCYTFMGFSCLLLHNAFGGGPGDHEFLLEGIKVRCY